jgi:hypothetical protein
MSKEEVLVARLDQQGGTYIAITTLLQVGLQQEA